jgi:carboxymethylenebutenolidase
MAIKGGWIDYGGDKGYFAVPEKAAEPLPAIIVIQELFGVNHHIEEVTRRLAAAGYAALAPDLFVTDGARPAMLAPARIDKMITFMRQLPPGAFGNPALRDAGLAALPEPDRTEIGETVGKLFSGGPDRLAQYLPRLKAAVHHLRAERPETREQKVACVGFCMGGGLSALLACEEPEISGAAMFYGSAPPADRIPSMRCPVIGFYGGNDQRINSGIPAFEEAMGAAGKSYERHMYEGANHSFFNDDGHAYDVKAVRDSFVRLLTFFYKVLSD